MRVQTKHDKKEGIQKLEGFIDFSNVKLVSAAAATGGKKTAAKTEKAEKTAKA